MTYLMETVPAVMRSATVAQCTPTRLSAAREAILVTIPAFGSGVGGYAYGGAIYAGDGLALTGGSFSSNVAAGGSSTNAGEAFGGALDSESTASLSATTFSGNGVSGGQGGSGEGGAVYLGGGSSSWTGLSFSANEAVASGTSSYAAGGAVASFAPLSLSGGTFTSNKAAVTGTGALGAVGGAVAVETGPFSLIGSATQNVATTEGGALWLDDVSLVKNTLISGNQVSAMQAPNDGGGGIYVSLGGTLTLTGSTLSANTVSGNIVSVGGGGIFNAGSSAISNSTIAGNSSAVDGGGFESDTTASSVLVNVTVYQNIAAGKGGNIKNLYSDSTMAISNTIVAGGKAAGSVNDISNDGTITSNDYNIVQALISGNPLKGLTAHNLTGEDPVLGALQDNGGPTPTDADGSSSPGTAYIPYSVCSAAGITVDQRQYPRNPTAMGFCDVGAFEDQTPNE